MKKSKSDMLFSVLVYTIMAIILIAEIYIIIICIQKIIEIKRTDSMAFFSGTVLSIMLMAFVVDVLKDISDSNNENKKPHDKCGNNGSEKPHDKN